MKELFEPATVGKIPLRNRLIRSATFEAAFGNDEAFADKLLSFYEDLARGGIGAIITGMVGVDENSRALPSMVKAYGDSFIPEMKQVTEKIHALGAKVIVQISHCGQKARQIDGGGRPLGPSEAEISPGVLAKAMSPDEIRAAALNFGQAAARCREAGADGVQIHGAHGYLLSEFLSPHFNRRTDEYGGNINGRAKIVFEVYDAVRNAVGQDYPVWIKLNSQDLTEKSISLEEFLWLGRELGQRGLEAIEVSGGVAVDSKSSSMQAVKNESEEGCFVRAALELAEPQRAQALPQIHGEPVIAAGNGFDSPLTTNTAASIISVCGFRTLGVMEKWLNQGQIEAFSLCRPLISEPGLINRWQQGDLTKARCLSCNKCFSPAAGIQCRAFSKAS